MYQRGHGSKPSATRQLICEYLAQHGQLLSDSNLVQRVTRDLGLGAGSVRWHIRCLEESGHIVVNRETVASGRGTITGIRASNCDELFPVARPAVYIPLLDQLWACGAVSPETAATSDVIERAIGWYPSKMYRQREAAATAGLIGTFSRGSGHPVRLWLTPSGIARYNQ